MGFSADAPAAISVAGVTCGGRAFNLVNAVATAYAERASVVLSGAPEAIDKTTAYPSLSKMRA